MKTNKTQWNKPELLVLTRSNPEESVLIGCKMKGGTGGPQNLKDNCTVKDPAGQAPCYAQERS